MRIAAALAATVGVCLADGGPRATLTYFDVRGLGQAPRLMLHDAGVEVEEVRHSKATWQEAKPKGIESGLFTFGQIPAMEYTRGNGEKVAMVQSVAIMQFLAREHGYYGGTNAEAAAIDVIAGGVGDVRKRYGAFSYNKNAQTDPSLLEGYKADLKTWLPYFEAAFGRHASPYVAGTAAISFADILLFDLIDTCVLRVDPTALDGLPKLAAHYELIGARPRIAAYLASEQNHPFANGPSAFFDNAEFVPAHLRKAAAKEEL